MEKTFTHLVNSKTTYLLQLILEQALISKKIVSTYFISRLLLFFTYINTYNLTQ